MSYHVENKRKRSLSQSVAKMFRNGQGGHSLNDEYYGQYLLKKASNGIHLNSSSCQDFSGANEYQNKNGRICGVSHSILCNGEKWEDCNEAGAIEGSSQTTVNSTSSNAMRSPAHRHTITRHSPDHIRCNRSAETVNRGISARSTGNYLSPYDFTIQTSSDSRIQHIPDSPTPKLNSAVGRLEIRTLDQQEAISERGSNIIRLNSVTDVESNYSDGSEMKCRYCFGGELGWIVKETLITPCWCSGSLAHVHRSCLEKWLTTKKQTNCDLCKYEFMIKMKYKPLKEIQFQGMEGEDIFLLIVTVLVYITFIFQFLAAAYLGLIADHIPASVLAVSMTGLGLGLFWFLIGCIALTVVTYTSEYWVSWRRVNKRISIVMSSINNGHKNRATEEGQDERNNEEEAES